MHVFGPPAACCASLLETSGDREGASQFLFGVGTCLAVGCGGHIDTGHTFRSQCTGARVLLTTNHALPLPAPVL